MCEIFWSTECLFCGDTNLFFFLTRDPFFIIHFPDYFYVSESQLVRVVFGLFNFEH